MIEISSHLNFIIDEIFVLTKWNNVNNLLIIYQLCFFVLWRKPFTRHNSTDRTNTKRGWNRHMGVTQVNGIDDWWNAGTRAPFLRYNKYSRVIIYFSSIGKPSKVAMVRSLNTFYCYFISFNMSKRKTRRKNDWNLWGILICWLKADCKTGAGGGVDM